MNATACYFMSAMADENTDIVRGLRRRDPELLDRLIEQYQHRLLRYLVYLSGRRDLAEDFFQETWVHVLERGGQYDGRHEFSTWLFTIARHLVIDHLRRERPTSLEGLTDQMIWPHSIFRPPGSLPHLMRRFNASKTNRFLPACSTSQPNTVKPCCFVFRKGCHWKKLPV